MKNQKKDPIYFQKMFIEALQREHDKNLVKELALEIEEFVDGDSTPLYYEIARMIYYRFPIFWIRLVMIYKHRKALNKSITNTMVRTIVDKQILQATKLIFRD
jgi:hypothetical protein